MKPMLPKVTKEVVMMGNYVFIVVGIVLMIVGLIIYLLTRKQAERKIVKYVGIGLFGLGLLSLLNNALQYFMFR